jgi:hypothetical protein
MKVLLVTIAIGDKYLAEYFNLFHESQRVYAAKNGYDFKLITNFLDNTYTMSRMSLYYQKMLVCNQAWSNKYDFIIFIDADILININSPPIHNYVDYGDCIGIVDEYSQPSKERRIHIQEKMGWEKSAVDYYKLCDIDIETDMVFNSGVLVMQPKKHNKFLLNVYKTYMPKSIIHRRGPHYEQSSLGYELQKAKCYKVIDNKFNAIWSLTAMDNIEDICLNKYFNRNYFIHFAGHVDFHKIPTIKQLNNMR